MAEQHKTTEKAERDAKQTAQETSRKTIEEMNRASRATADVLANATRSGTDQMKRSSEAVQQAWESSTKMASQLAEHSMQRFARAFGMGGDNAQQSATQTSRNFECVTQSGTILTDGMQHVTKEVFELARTCMERNLQQLDMLLESRTPHEVVAAQSELLRDNLDSFLQSTRKISEISLQVANDAARKMKELKPASAEY